MIELRLTSDQGPVHRKGIKGHRRLYGDELREKKELLKSSKPFKVRQGLLTDADKEALKTGKLNEVKTLEGNESVNHFKIPMLRSKVKLFS